MPSKVSVADANAFLQQAFERREGRSEVIALEEDYAVMRLQVTSEHLRPGGYISGPTQMAMADSAAYVAVFTRLGITPMAVTSNFNMNFMRPCIGEAVIAEASLMKLGKTLAVINVSIRAEGSDKVSSHAVVNYSLPLSD